MQLKTKVNIHRRLPTIGYEYLPPWRFRRLVSRTDVDGRSAAAPAAKAAGGDARAMPTADRGTKLPHLLECKLQSASAADDGISILRDG